MARLASVHARQQRRLDAVVQVCVGLRFFDHARVAADAAARDRSAARGGEHGVLDVGSAVIAKPLASRLLEAHPVEHLLHQRRVAADPGDGHRLGLEAAQAGKGFVRRGANHNRVFVVAVGKVALCTVAG